MNNNSFYRDFQSLKTRTQYQFYMNLASGYYEINSQFGNIKLEGFTLFDPRIMDLNQFTNNIVNQFFNL